MRLTILLRTPPATTGPEPAARVRSTTVESQLDRLQKVENSLNGYFEFLFEEKIFIVKN